jgi:3-phenylpropionate/trans-cinnamate dioxygenase ferredoxin subunit
MNKNNWIYVLDNDSLPEGSLVAIYPLGVNVVMARANGTAYAISGKCAHMGCPLFTGTLAGAILTCPCHDWRFNIQTGEFLDATELRLQVYPVRAENGKLFINLI